MAGKRIGTGYSNELIVVSQDGSTLSSTITKSKQSRSDCFLVEVVVASRNMSHNTGQPTLKVKLVESIQANIEGHKRFFEESWVGRKSPTWIWFAIAMKFQAEVTEKFSRECGTEFAFATG